MKRPDNDQYFVFGAIPMCANRLQTIGSIVTQTITFKQWLVLLVVRDMPKDSTLSQIAEQHGSSHQNVKKLLCGLEDMGYVTLQSSEEDRRSCEVTLTEKGKKDMQQISQRGSLFVGEVFEGIDENDVAAARRVIDQMLENLGHIKNERDHR